MADLIPSGMMYWPDPAKNGQPVSIKVGVKNVGNAPAYQFYVEWLSNQTDPGCKWSVEKLAAGKRVDLECEFTYNLHASSYYIELVVDSTNRVQESNESNNTQSGKLKAK